MAKIKEVWCIHHSHLDIGYTHPAPMIMDYESDFIEQAIDLCQKTADYPEEAQFRWTCEATHAVMLWFKTASPERIELFKKFAKEGRISVAALPMHTTPCVTAPEISYMLSDLDEIREKLDIPIQTAINHDVNGQPWTMAQTLLDSGVNFYETGINVHYGGLPFKRPSFFRWKAADGRELLTFLGEHYSMFSQHLHTDERDLKKAHEGLCAYIKTLEDNNYPYDFAILTATNPPAYDNNNPDVWLPDLIAKYNEEGHEQRLRFATPEMIRDRLIEYGVEKLPVYGGDWTDYWNFGCASSARETMINRRAKDNFQRADMIECLTEFNSKHYDSVRKKGFDNSVIYDEHTWGAYTSISDPDDIFVTEQQAHKLITAYNAHSSSAYMLGTQLEKLAGNEYETNEIEGVVAVNPSSVTQNYRLRVPKEYFEKKLQLGAMRGRDYLVYSKPETVDCGVLKLPPFSYRKIPMSELQNMQSENDNKKTDWNITENTFETPYYTVTYSPVSGRILQLHDRVRNVDLIDESSPWAFFEAVRESLDTRFEKNERNSLFEQVPGWDKGYASGWKTNWRARRAAAENIKEWKIEQDGGEISIEWESEFPGFKTLTQKVTFYADTPHISLFAAGVKLPVRMPESLYFTFPLKMNENWDCIYDTAGQFVKLDDEQLGSVCRDYFTVDQSVSIAGGKHAVTLLCPDAPMVQAGNFNFGRLNKRIERNENPLLLAWPMNNYWNTNFVADQSGTVEFRYGITVQDKFNPNAVYEAICSAREICTLGALHHCSSAETGELLQTGGDAVALYIRRGKDKNSLVITLCNPSDNEAVYTVKLPSEKPMDASWISPQEKELQKIAENKISLSIPVAPRKIGEVKIKIK